jgi:hypothetical protein
MACPRQKKEVIWRRIGDTIVVIKEDGLSSHVLNKTAAFIWELCDGNLDTDAIATRVHQHFDVPLENARSDTLELMEELKRAGILSTVRGIGGRKSKS